uniref:Glycosyltransferase RgtA/B/C/D-like domain-containing protein n=1 Tax=Solibacter usitatus (strain Ellin6076) TaxID=234267 RepID=Q01PM0_SOLUE
MAITLRLAMLPVLPIPVPVCHDEFSYLLGSDTFASGRVTNPAHPMWVHFETFHVNQQPTYCSKYPPAQALFLAAGQAFFGHPWFGVCLSMGLMFAALCWMLLAWVEPVPALLTSVLCLLGWAFTGTWINSYWGGAVAAAGGALLVGAIPRIITAPGAASVLSAAFGVVLLANSRPYEGLLTVIAAGLVFAWRWRSKGIPSASVLVRTALPFLAILLPAFAAMGYYNYRTTKNPVLMPYVVNQRTYTASPFFYVLPPVPAPAYRHEVIRKYWVDWVVPFYLKARADPRVAITKSAKIMWRFYFLTPILPALLIGLLFGARRDVGAALAIAAGPVLGLLPAESALPHYLAPAFGAFVLIVGLGMQALWRWQYKNVRAGAVLSVAVLWISLGFCAHQIVVEMFLMKHTDAPIATKPLLTEQLQKQPGMHLVIVRYGANHKIDHEWVYNRADIDASRIVWAQDMGAAKNQELLDYYRDRKFWLLQPDIDPLAIVPYTEP